MTTRSEEARAYRQRKRAELGEEEFKRLEREARAARRARNKAEQPEIKLPEPVVPAQKELQTIIKQLNKILTKNAKIDIPLVEALIKDKTIPVIVKIDDQKNCGELKKAIIAAKFQLAKKEGKTITRQTIDQQFAKVLNLYRLIHKQQPDCKNLDFLKDTGAVIKTIESNPKWKTNNSRNAQIQAISSILRVLKGFEEPYKFYSQLSTAGRKTILEEGDESKTTEKEAKNILGWSKLKDLYKQPKLSKKDRALISLYTLIPPRRVEMSQWLRIKYNDKNLNKNYNHLIVDQKTNEPEKIVLLKYKTFKTFGRQELELPGELKRVLKEYIDDEGLDNGDPMFANTHDEHYRNFNSILTNVFKKASGKNISVNLLRHSYISNFLSTKRSIKQKKELATAMAHSVETQSRYDRIDLDDVNEIKDV